MLKSSSGKNSQALLLVVLVAALLFAFYYYLVLPKKDEVASVEGQIQSLNSQVAQLQQSITQLQTVEKPKPVDYYSLRKKVPQTRAVDDLLRNIEQIEFVSGIRVSSIGFNNYDSLVSSSAFVDPNQQNPDGTAPGEPSTETVPTEATSETAPVGSVPVTTISAAQLPPALKLLSLSLSIETPDNASLQLFIREIEGLERVVRVDNISYTLPDELAAIDPTKAANLSASIQVTTFYYEGEQ